MRKNIKQVLSSSIIILSVMFGFVVYAEETKTSEQPVACTMDAKICPDGTSVGRSLPNCEFVCPGENTPRDINTNKNKIAERKVQLEQIIQSIKEKRTLFKLNMEVSKEQAKLKIEEMKTSLRLNLSKIKDEGKKISIEKIVSLVQSINTKTTDIFSKKIDQIENVLISIESRISKAEDKGLDVSSVKIEVTKSEQAIEEVRGFISIQSEKVYEVSITSESTLKTEMKNLRDSFSKDIKALISEVKFVRETVKNTATMLAQIPKIDEVETNNNIVNN